MKTVVLEAITVIGILAVTLYALPIIGMLTSFSG